ncbi:hypothetical protein ACFL6C_03865 [Myxococcota bacterium]
MCKKTGLRVRSRGDDRVYGKVRQVSDKELAAVNLKLHVYCGEWNCTIHPRESAQ